MRFALGLAVILEVLFLAFRVFAQERRGRMFGVGPGAAGTIYDMLNEDKRKATGP